MLLLSSVLVFAAVCMAVFSLAAAMDPGAAGARLRRLDSAGASAAEEVESDDQGLLDEESSWLVRMLAPLAGVGGRRKQKGPLSKLRLRLLQAGYRRESSLVIYLGGRIALAVGLAVLSWSASLPLIARPGFDLLVPLVAAAIGYVGPSMWLDMKLRRRRDEIDRNLPTALDLMVVCIEAGLGLVQSLSRVGVELARTSPALAEEFELVHLESRTGKSNADALRALAQRTGVREVSVLVAMLIQTERFGTNLADALRVHCDTMRVTRMQRAEEQAAKAPLKMLFPTAMILLALLTLILGLAAIKASSVFSA